MYSKYGPVNLDDREDDGLFDPEDALPCDTLGHCIGPECPEWGGCLLCQLP